MYRRAMALLPRGRELLGIVVLTSAACGPPVEPRTPVAAATCEGPKLAGCERDLGKALTAGTVTAPMIAAYVAGRASQDSADPWSNVWAALSERGAVTAVVVDARGAKARVAAPGVKVVASAALPEPGALAGTDLLLAMGTAAGYHHVVWLGAGDGGRAYEIFPNDPMEQEMLGLRGVARDDAAADHLAKNVELAATLRRAFEAAGAFKYIDAAREATALGAMIDERDPFEEPVLRARYGRSLLSGAGLVLDPGAHLFSKGSDDDKDRPLKTPEAPPPAATDTPYGDLLRVRLAEDRAKEWGRRRATLMAAIPEERREIASTFYTPAGACPEVTLPPAFDRTGDLALTGLLPMSLAGARTDPIAITQPAGLPLSVWYPRYEAAVTLVDRSHLWWLEVGTLLRQRGELNGITAAGSPTYRRVTEKALAHIAALRELSEAEPEKYAGTAELGLAYLPGLLGDDAVRAALIDLTQGTTKGKLARADEPETIAGSLVLAALTGMSYPSALQAAHYLALQSAFAAKVKGDLTRKTGWGAAGLFTIDAVVRILADLGPNLAFSSDQIVRALSDPNIALPNVAAVASAAARYAALAKDRPLAAIVTPAKSTPERATAREALRKAILGMGAPGEAPASLADDITTLADGLIATLTIAAHRRPLPPGTCSDKRTAEDIEIGHALTKLAAVRGKILQSPSYKKGDGLWTRRARLLVSVLSDAMDLARPEKKGTPKQLTLPAKDVEAAIAGALREWDEAGARDAIAGVYGLARFFLTGDPTKRFEAGGPYLVQALGGIGKFLRGDGPAKVPTMLDALAEMSGKQATPEDIASALVTYAKAFYAKGQADQGDVFLLGTILVTAVRDTAPPKEAIELAAANRSRIGWALSLFAEVASAEATGKVDVAAYAPAARKAAEEACAIARAGDTIEVLGAVGQWTAGKRKEARAAFSGVLARAEREGLVVPRLSYQYTEKHDKKMFTLSFALTQGAGFVNSANTAQVGLGFSTLPERWTKLTTGSASPEETAEETARYYVRTAALAAAYDFLDGDPAQGAINARRAVSAATFGVRLGARSLTADRSKWAEEARSMLALDAQLAADAGLPFLAGDVWTVVKGTLAPETDDAKLGEVLSHTPLGLAGSKDAEGPIARAKRSLKVVAEPLACTNEKVDTAVYEKASCADYPLALALRIADVVKKLPRLRKGKGSCAPMEALDAFLDPADRGAYDPDAFTKAVEALRAGGLADEAAVLLGRHRRDGHCNAALLKAARELGRSPALLPVSRSDMLAVAVNCWAGGATEELAKDLAALDEETRKLADPMRNLRVLLFVAETALRNDKPELLLALVRAPGFVDRFLRMHGNAVAGALLMHHAAHVLAGEAFEPAQTEDTFALVCSSFPSQERRAECDDVKAMRDGSKPAPIRRALAKDALRRLLSPPAPPQKP